MPAPLSSNLTPTVYQTVPGVELLELSLQPEEAFVLSCVDEEKVADAISGATGLALARVRRHLDRLVAVGAITAHDPARAVDESLSISVAVQQSIIEMSLRLDSMTHFEVLGVESGADKSAVKKAYFSHIGTFHPDTYFKKDLGTFTKRMEKIFQKMTEAHDVLTHPQSRKEYESYLIAVGKTRPRVPSDTSITEGVDDLEALLTMAEQASSGASLTSPPPKSPTDPPSNPQDSLGSKPALRPPPLPPRPPQASVAPRPMPTRPPRDPKARRQALARKLGKAPPESNGPKKKPEPRDNTQARVAAVRNLKERYEHRKEAIEDQRLDRYVSAAEHALQAGNPVSALNAIRIATGVSGGSPSLRVKIEALETKACENLADSYLERARYEESNGHYEQAARSFGLSAKGRPSSGVLRNAAECYLKAGVDLKEAADLARRAVNLAPEQIDVRLTLVKVYEAAGMRTSAQNELDRIVQIAPNSEQVKQWVKRLRRGGV